MSAYFSEPKPLGWRVKVELELSNYTIKAHLKNATGVDTSKFAKKKYNLANLKSNIDMLDTDILKNVPTNHDKHLLMINILLIKNLIS